MSTSTNNPTPRSNYSYPRLAPTIPFFPRHFYPLEYTDLFVYAEMGSPIRDSEDNPKAWKPVLFYLVLHLLFGFIVLALIAWSHQQPEPVISQPMHYEPPQVSAALVMDPLPPSYPTPKPTATPNEASTQAKWVLCEPGTCLHERCLYLPSSANGNGLENRVEKLCIGSPDGTHQSTRAGNYAIRSLRVVQQDRYNCQWLGLERV